MVDAICPIQFDQLSMIIIKKRESG